MGNIEKEGIKPMEQQKEEETETKATPEEMKASTGENEGASLLRARY
jgi:hypothetical protein